MKYLLIGVFFLSSFGFAQEINEGLKQGVEAPEIILPTIDGEEFRLSTLQGKVVVIDFWASWCQPCVKEQPELKQLYQEVQEKGLGDQFEILGVSLDKNKEDWKRLVERLEIKWPQVGDLLFWRSPVAEDYDINGLPFNVLVDKAGKIIEVNLHGEALKEAVFKHLK